MVLNKDKSITLKSLIRNKATLFMDALAAQLRHFLFDFSAGKFIFGLYAMLILGGTTVLFLSQYQRLNMDVFNIDQLIWEQLEYVALLWNNGELNFSTLAETFNTLWFNLDEDGHWGIINVNNFNILVDTLFTATSAVCLTGMTTCDISVYPEEIIFLLSALGAGSLMVFALLFNINSYFQTDTSPHSALSLGDFAEAKRMGRFTIKVMYTIISLGTLVLTLYFLPPQSVTDFLLQEWRALRAFCQERWIFIAIVWMGLGVISVFLWMIWNKVAWVRNAIKTFIHKDSVYYTCLTGLVFGILGYMYLSGNSWEKQEYLFMSRNALLLSVSAFTNAGFDTFSGELVQRLGHKHANQIFTFIMITLIGFGSLGMQVIRELPKVIYELFQGVYDIFHNNFHYKKLAMKISLDTRLILSTNLILWVGGGLLFYFLEQHNSLSQLTELETFTSTAFQTMNMRTSGFTTRVDVGAYSSPTLLFVMFMMLIGGSPNSMSGGMKTTTIAVLVLAARALLLQKEELRVFGERISRDTIYKAMVTAVLTLGALFMALMLIFCFYDGAQGNYLRIAFDVVGAFTTIGLNTGISDWNNICKLILIVCMCFGKIGVIVIGMTLVNRNSSRKKIRR